MNEPGAAAPLLLKSRDDVDTQRWGAELARSIVPLLGGARAFVVALSGPLGAGKTTLVRGLLAHLGVRSAVRSPSYALLENYDTPHCQALHVDLYRLSHPEEVEGLGLRDFDNPGALWLVEWPERAAGLLPPADLRAQLRIESDYHEITLTAGSQSGIAVLRQLRAQTVGLA